jgi:osmotically-inducible protein OsmY
MKLWLCGSHQSLFLMATVPFRRGRLVEKAGGVMVMCSQPEHAGAEEIVGLARAALRSLPRLGPRFHLEELAVESDGVLLVRGEVADVASKKLALVELGKVAGVRGIADHLHVKPAAIMQDDEIRVHVRNGLLGEPGFEGLEIHEFDNDDFLLIRGAPGGATGVVRIEVKRGVVILTGRVPSLVSKRLAGVIAWWVPGSRDVVNGLEVDPPEEDGPDRLAEAVRYALEKDPLVNTDGIKVGVRKTVVRLTGSVPSDVQRSAAERDAWMMFAVDNVINELVVAP